MGAWLLRIVLAAPETPGVAGDTLPPSLAAEQEPASSTVVFDAPSYSWWDDLLFRLGLQDLYLGAAFWWGVGAVAAIIVLILWFRHARRKNRVRTMQKELIAFGERVETADDPDVLEKTVKVMSGIMRRTESDEIRGRLNKKQVAFLSQIYAMHCGNANAKLSRLRNDKILACVIQVRGTLARLAEKQGIKTPTEIKQLVLPRKDDVIPEMLMPPEDHPF